jgi:hypothetical protein
MKESFKSLNVIFCTDDHFKSDITRWLWLLNQADTKTSDVAAG